MKRYPLILTTIVSIAALGIAATRVATTVEVDGKLLLEVNATDQDAEIVMLFDGDPPLQRFMLKDPTGHPVLDLKSRDLLGLHHIALETGEPGIQEVLAAYPEGTYTYRAKGINGGMVTGAVTLTHDLTAAPSLISPVDGELDVVTTGLTLQWQVDPMAAEYVLELESDEFKLLITMPGGTGQFNVPAGLLQPATEHGWQVRAVNAAGNIIATESSFTTAG